MKKIIVFCPIKETETIKNAMFNAGGGMIGNYDQCSFESRGIGQFRPLSGSNAFVGECDKLEKVEEIKLEMVCENTLINEVIAAMKKVHPYEEVAFEVYTLDTY